MGLGKLEITSPIVLLGEGAGDQALFKYLCEVHSITDVQCIDAGGSGKYGEFLKNIDAVTGFKKNCRTLIVSADNDDSMDANFGDVRKALKSAKLPVPNEPLKRLEHTNRDLGVAVMMVPFDEKFQRRRGCLETLLLEALQTSQPVFSGCVPAFEICVGANIWANGSHRDKFRLRAILAALFSHDPNFSLQYAVEPKHRAIPLDHPCFSPIVAFIQQMQAETP